MLACLLFGKLYYKVIQASCSLHAGTFRVYSNVWSSDLSAYASVHMVDADNLACVAGSGENRCLTRRRALARATGPNSIESQTCC